MIMLRFGDLVVRASDVSAVSIASATPTVSSIPNIIGPNSQVDPNLGNARAILPNPVFNLPTLGIVPLDGDDEPKNTTVLSTSSATQSASSSSPTATSTSDTSTSSASATSSTGSSSATLTESSSAVSNTSSTTASSASDASTASSTSDTILSSTSTADETSVTPAPEPQAAETSDPGVQFSTSLVTASNSLSASAADASANVSEASTSPKSFLDNKPLSISVIVGASIVGLVLLMVVATWALRKRGRARLEDLAGQLSTDDLMGVQHNHGDIEKASTYGGSRSGDVIEKMEAVAGGRNEVGRYPVTRNVSSGSSRAGPLGQPSAAAYEQARYPAVPVFAPQQGYGGTQQTIQDYGRGRGYGQVPYGQTQAYGQMQAYGQAQLYDRGQPAYRGGADYAQEQGYDQAYDGMVPSSYLPNPFESAGALVAPPPVFDLAQAAPSPTQEFISTRGIQRKPPPPLLTLNIPPTPPVAAEYSAISLRASPMQPVNPVNPAYPGPSPSTPGTPRRSSVPNSPRTPRTSGSGRMSYDGYDARRGKSLDHTLPPIAATPPLQEELGLPKSAKTPRQFKVVNK